MSRARLRDRVPVAPLAEERWARLERRIIAGAREAPVARRWPRWLAAAALTCAVAAAVVVVTRTRPGAELPALAAAMPTKVVAGAGGSRVDLGDVVLELAAGTALEIRRDASGVVTIELASGGVDLDVAPRGQRPPLRVQAADVAVVVVGTRFRVERGDDIEVSVSHGVVRVERGGAQELIAAGQRWRGATVVATATLGESGEPDGRTGTGTGTGAVGPLALANDEHSPELAGRTTAVPVRPAVPGAAEQGGGHRGGTGARAPGGADPDTAAPAPERAHAHAHALALADQPLAPLLILDGASDDGDERVRRYTAIVGEHDSRRAAHALYSMAHVQYLELHRSSDALRSLLAYERRFPRGAEAESVLWLRLRILCSDRVDDACRAAAHTFLDKFSDSGERARIAERLIDQL